MTTYDAIKKLPREIDGCELYISKDSDGWHLGYHYLFGTLSFPSLDEAIAALRRQIPSRELAF